MNDFTKDELEYLNRLVVNLVQNNDDFKNINLHKKLQSMIDNYCEHDYENQCCGCELQWIVCKKCERCFA